MGYRLPEEPSWPLVSDGIKSWARRRRKVAAKTRAIPAKRSVHSQLPSGPTMPPLRGAGPEKLDWRRWPGMVTPLVATP
jgi:hypothetical protein